MNDKLKEATENIFKVELAKALDAIGEALQELDKRTLDFEKRMAHLEFLMRQQLYYKGNLNE